MVDDLLLNLLAEATGIAATVFFVDRLLQRRERHLWLTPRNAIYSRLFSAVEEFVDSLFLPLSVLGRDNSLSVFVFGNHEIRGHPINGTSESHSYELLDCLRSRFQLGEALKTSELPETAGVNELRAELRTIFTMAGPTLDHTLTGLLLNLENRMTEWTTLSEALRRDETVMTVTIARTAEQALDVLRYLHSKADRSISLQQHSREVIEHAQRLLEKFGLPPLKAPETQVSANDVEP